MTAGDKGPRGGAVDPEASAPIRHTVAGIWCVTIPADEYDALRARGADVRGDVPRTAEDQPVKHNAIVEAARRVCETHLRAALEDIAEGECAYGDACPTFGSRHGQCTPCKAREALQDSTHRTGAAK